MRPENIFEIDIKRRSDRFSYQPPSWGVHCPLSDKPQSHHLGRSYPMQGMMVKCNGINDQDRIFDKYLQIAAIYSAPCCYWENSSDDFMKDIRSKLISKIRRIRSARRMIAKMKKLNGDIPKSVECSIISFYS